MPTAYVIPPEGKTLITPAEAAYILKSLNYERQRPLDPNAVILWKQMIADGDFSADHQIWFARLPDGVVKLVDGQHRLAATAAGKTDVQFMVMYLAVANAEEVHQAYAMFDRVGRPRTLSEVMRTFDTMKEHGLSAAAAKTVFHCSLILHFDFAPPHHSQDPVAVRSDKRRMAYAEPWWGLAREYEKLIKHAPTVFKKRLLSVQVMTAALLTLRDQPEQARLFWSAIAANDGLRRGDPRHALVGWLSQTMFQRNGGGANWRTMDGAIACSLAWNAFYEHRQIDTLKLGQTKTLRFAGTSMAKGAK